MPAFSLISHDLATFVTNRPGLKVWAVTFMLGIVANSLAIESVAAAEDQSGTIGDKYSFTEKEKAACTPDAQAFCADTFPDEDRLLACLKANRPNLGNACKPVFEAGMKKRGL